MPAPLPISVVIISLNEERRMGACLASVRELTSDIIVVDAGSTDRTVEIATAAGARVFGRDWTGYSDQKNHGNERAHHHWILSLDADERVSAELASSLRIEWARGPQRDAYNLRFHNYFGASLVRFGAWNPEFHVRLFDRRKFDWNREQVHEGLRGEEGARVGKLAGCIRHHTVNSHAELAAKTECYSALFAEKMKRKGRQPSWPKVWLNPAFRFARDYLFYGGLLDGRAGLAIAWEAGRYTHLKYRRARPVPSVSSQPTWSQAWRVAGATAGLALLIAMAAGGRWTDGQAADNLRVAVAAQTAADREDGFDNNPVIPLMWWVEDDEVWI